jgi:ABC-type multidrug transport system ATPase subunit
MVGYLPQEFTTFPKLAAWEFLDYTAALSGVRSRAERMRRIDRLLDEVGLYPARDRLANKLSGGMKRRLGIAQTLIGEPRIMVVDEPTVGLDPEERLRFRNLMADLSQQDRIIILSTHIVGDISSTCSELALLHTGKIVFGGAPSALTESARGRVWRVPAAHTELDQLKSTYPVISAVPSEGGYELRVVADAPPNAGATALEPNIEDAYIHFIQSLGHDMNLEATANGW